MFIYFWERERESMYEAGERQREIETEDPKQALCWQQRTQGGVQTHEFTASWSEMKSDA